jgi:hypothetical protein
MNLFILKKLAKEFRIQGENEICNKIVFAISSEINAQDARPDLSYSFVCRELRKTDLEKLREFQIAFKKAFDEAFLAGLDNIDDVAMLQAVKETNLELP